MKNIKSKFSTRLNSTSGFRIAIFSLLLISFCKASFPQSIKDDKSNPGISFLKEDLKITTDRDVYIAGEELWVKINIRNAFTSRPDNISKVVYLELLDRNNFPLKQIKISVDAGSCSTNMVLPDKVSTGNYILRAYTGLLKNWSASDYAMRTISVINPFENLDNTKLSDSIASIIPQKSMNTKNGEVTCDIRINGEKFSPRQKINIDLAVKDNSFAPSDLSVSVIKSVLYNKYSEEIPVRPVNSGADNIVIAETLPETEGLLVSGSLRKKSNYEPLANTNVSLAYVGKTARCQFTRTDGKGEFNFVVKETGRDEIVIQPLFTETSDYYVDLKQPFSSKFEAFRANLFLPDTNDIYELNRAVIAMQVNNIYAAERQKKTAVKIYPEFYGSSENTVRMDDYIELTTVHEAVKEIIPNVYVSKHDGVYDFKLINKFNQIFENKPLVLLDGVPVYNMEKILDISAKEIERVDVINTRYFFSDNVFDGIISFVTRKGNLSVLDFDNSIFRQVYDFCKDQETFYSPDYSTDNISLDRIPDYRNTLYWNPSVQTGPAGQLLLQYVLCKNDESPGIRGRMRGEELSASLFLHQA
ncbi:MAG TPA: hypothetical protein VHP38_11050 [Ruminiclostridium sp.]|nr:hypothetical protein [Ruminiclostridium sp.]